MDRMTLALSRLRGLNNNLYQKWMEILYDENGNKVENEWNSDNIRDIENDVYSFSILRSI